VRDKTGGFTLLEILVGLTVSSLILIGLSQAMTTIDRGFEQATESIGRQGTIATGLRIVAGDISRIQRVLDVPEQPTRFLFEGTGNRATYVVAERPGNNRAGLYWVRLAVRDTEDGQELVRMRAPFVAADRDSAIAWRDEVVLLRGGMAIALSYRAPRAGLRSWAADWPAGDLMPGQIKIELTDLATGRLRVPVFVQTLKIGAEADCVTAAASGCTLQSEGRIVPRGRDR
jgi:general secretion pathway protein J